MNKFNAGTIADTQHIQHNTVHPACELSPNKHQMAFLFLDGEAWQRCRGTEEGGGQEWEWKWTAEGPYLAKRITSLRLASRLLSVDKNSLFTGM